MSLSFLKILPCWYSPFQKMKTEKFSCWTLFSYFSYMLKVPFTHLYDYEHLNVNLTYELRLSANGLGLNDISFRINKGWRLRSLVQSVHKCESYYLLLFFFCKLVFYSSFLSGIHSFCFFVILLELSYTTIVKIILTHTCLASYFTSHHSVNFLGELLISKIQHFIILIYKRFFLPSYFQDI